MNEWLEKTINLIMAERPAAEDFFGQDYDTPALFLEDDETPLFI